MRKIYLDYAAATPLDNDVFRAMKPYFVDKFYNPSATYLVAKSVNRDIQSARAKVASILGVRPAEIFFTAGGTEANNLAIRGVLESFNGSNVVVSAIEHDSVLEPAKLYDHQIVAVHPDGRISLESLKKSINDQTVLVSIMYANNEIGTVQHLSEISKIIDEKRQLRQADSNKLPLYFHTDAAQAGNYLPLLAHRLGVDMMTINGGKLYGPKQTGVLYVKAGTKILPQVLGGGQEFGLRSGTENPAGIIGFAEALIKAQQIRNDESKRLSELRRLFVEELNHQIPQALITANPKLVLPNNVHITLPGQDNERVMMSLDEHGIICATGSACSASSDEPSHVLKAIGLSDKDAQSSLRFTLGRRTSDKEIIQTIKILAKIIV